MNFFPPMSVAGIDTARCHGGNEYRGQGAWKRPRGNKNRLRPSASEPLDLSAVLGEEWQSNQDDDSRHRRKISTHDRNEQKSRRRRVVVMQKKLKSLSICLAPSSGAVASFPAGGHVYPQGSLYDHTPTALDPPISSIDASTARLGRHQRLEQRGGCGNIAEQKTDSNMALAQHASRDGPGGGATKDLGSISFGDQHDTWNNSATKVSTDVPQTKTQEKRSTKHIIFDSSALRIPNTATRMFIDRKYNDEMLGARAALRELVREQAELGKDTHRLRPQANLDKRGGLDEGVSRRHDNPAALTGLQGRRRREKAPGGSVSSARRIRKHSSALCPLPFYSERALRQYEITQMGLEDSMAHNFARWEEARQRKLDYATYYTCAEQYGPLSEREFNRNVSSPGRAYYAKAFDAARSVQVWWWTVWPPLLRRRKAAALAIQATFRGFLQRRKWGTLIKLRVIWGKTRINVHSFKVWRHTVAKTKQVKAFACRFRKNCKARCFTALFGLLKQRREARQDMLRKYLRQVSLRVQLRVFEAWAKHAEKSLAVTRMNFRSVTWPAFTVWRLTISEIRLRGACAVLAGRFLRQQCNGRYRRLKTACMKVQRAARVRIAWTRVQRSLGYEREHRAREIVQLREDERIRDLLDTERKRRNRFQEIIYRDTPRHQKDASIFLRTAAGRQAVASALAEKISESELKLSLEDPQRSSSGCNISTSGDDAVPAATKVAETEAEDKVIRMFILREQAAARHDFDTAFPPPPLRCPRPDCDATFVERAHCVRHGADVHPQDSPEIWTLTSLLSDSLGMVVFEEYLHDSAVYDDNVDEQNAAIGLLERLKIFQEWRTVPSSSDRFEELTQSTWVRCEAWVSNIHIVDQPYAVSENAEEWTIGKRRKPFGLRYNPRLKKKGESAVVLAREHTRKRAFQVQAIEDASWQILAALHKSIGGRFLRSKQYESYIEGVARVRNRDIAVVAAEIAEQERAKWSAEARSLRQAAVRLKQDASTEALAMEATERILGETTAASAAAENGFLEGLVDDQVALLAVIIIAERTAFVKVISAVWNQVVDEAAHLITREKRGLDPRVVEVFSDAASTLTLANTAEALIDQAVLGLIGPDGEFWPDARAVAAVADGIAYRVRSDIMDELLEAAVYELEHSGESETLVLGHTVGINHGDEEDGAGGDSSTSSGVETSRGTCADGMNTDDLYRKEEPQPSPVLTMTSTVLSPPSGVLDAKVIHAITVIQSAQRRKAAIRETRSLVAQNFTKMYDAQSGSLYWYNHGTGESSWERPIIVDNFFKRKSSANPRSLSFVVRASESDSFSTKDSFP